MLPLVNVHVALSIGLSVVTAGTVFDVRCALVVLCLNTCTMIRIWFHRSRASVKSQNCVGFVKKGTSYCPSGSQQTVSRVNVAQHNIRLISVSAFA